MSLLKTSVRIRPWPWSAKGEELREFKGNEACAFPYFGSPLLELEKEAEITLSRRKEKFIPLGSLFSKGERLHLLYEMPHGCLSANPEKEILRKIEPDFTVTKEKHAFSYKIEPYGAQERFDGPAPTPLNRLVMAWARAFDELAEYSADTEKGKADWKKLPLYLLFLSGKADEPHMALIVKLADQLPRKVDTVVQKARRILVRERRLLPISRITEMDSHCLQWYIRQPGKDMAEKAAQNRQSLLGISRRESFDTLENRVLKAFLRLAESVAQQYLLTEVGEKFKQSHRAVIVRQFRNLCSSLSRHENLKGVHKISGRVLPNYVLLQDPKYKRIWEEYGRLLREEEEKDKSWDWQGRTWADVCRLLISGSFFSNDDTDGPFAIEALLNSNMYFRREQELGARKYPGREPGPFIIKREGKPSWMLEIVHPAEIYAHLGTLGLGSLGAHLYLVLQKFNDEKIVVPVWCVHTASTKLYWNPAFISEDAFSNLQIHRANFPANKQNLPIFPFILASSLEKGKIAIFRSRKEGIPVIEIPADPESWCNARIDFQRFLFAFIREITA